MSEADRLRWNTRYRDGDAPDEPSAFLMDSAELLPTEGSALDIAGGSGRNAIWLASRGLDATMIDVSDDAIALARTRSRQANVELALLQHDLDSGLPDGRWDLIVCFHYLSRPLFAHIGDHLAPDGTLILALATTRNLESHERPPRPYLLDEGEAPTLFPDLDVVMYEEGWMDEGRHEARLVARKPAAEEA